MFRTLLIVAYVWIGFVSWLPAQETAVAEPPTQAFVLPATDDGLPGAGPIRSYDWFKNLWNNRRSKFAADAEKQTGAIVFLGDSITQGWDDNFRGDFGNANVANRGISGDTTRGMLMRLQQDVLSLDPAGVVMLMGTNDLEEKANPAMIAGNVRLIMAELKEHNASMPIVWCNVFPSSDSKSRPANKIKEINRLVAADIKGDAQVTVVDTWTLFADKNGDAKKSEFPDLLHPNGIGYAKWKLAITPVLETLGLIDVPADVFQIEAGYESLFNGKDLSGWRFLPTTEQMKKGRERWLSRDKNAPVWPIVTEELQFDNKASTPAGRYVAKNGRLVVTTPPEGRKIQQLWTTKEFAGDFRLVLEFRATPNADSGVFLRQPQLQCRDFALAGPYKKLKNYKAQDWNELVVEVKGSVAHCTCNGEVIEEAFKVPETSGPIGLEGDRGQVEYRRIRIKAL
ncbi:GDSL-type esterase/lipase family protein [Planctomycetes bacterium K23_9]|uniref:GDSL-like Lipase/Acylhydrolase n=1 Tax=Stieleria marina TaxID=1930275 RepID=A0A517NMT1_9BACT|nr:GDSL-like Lipase/Acylhydrolase [Planctomycetes bacterium K23_9]